MGFYPKPWYYAETFWRVTFTEGEVIAVNRAPHFSQVGFHGFGDVEPIWTNTGWDLSDLAVGDRAWMGFIGRTDMETGWKFFLARQNPPAALPLSEFVDAWPFYPYATQSNNHDVFELLYFQWYAALRTVFPDEDEEANAYMSQEASRLAIEGLGRRLIRYRPKRPPHLHLEY